MASNITYENEDYKLVSNCCIIDKHTDQYVGSVHNGGIQWAEPDWQTKRAVSAFVGECAMNGVVFNKEN